MILYILRIMRNYVVDEHYWENSLSHKVMLHSHHEYEIYMFLEGDCYYVVDGRRYELSKGDIIIIRKVDSPILVNVKRGVYKYVY